MGRSPCLCLRMQQRRLVCRLRTSNGTSIATETSTGVVQVEAFSRLEDLTNAGACLAHGQASREFVSACSVRIQFFFHLCANTRNTRRTCDLLSLLKTPLNSLGSVARRTAAMNRRLSGSGTVPALKIEIQCSKKTGLHAPSLNNFFLGWFPWDHCWIVSGHGHLASSHVRA